ncbi:MAG: SDR family oxidoreductase [Candidatus Krumholzibacteriia bacterium]
MRASRVLITGCGGMLGKAVYSCFAERYPQVVATDKDVNEAWLEFLDVCDRDNLECYFEKHRPELVLHLAAETDLEFCETHPDVAEATNSLATKHIAELSERYDSTLVYISTAGVFDGEKNGLYTENDSPRPIMVYGQTKYDGEVHVRNCCRKHYVIRAGWMVGGGTGKDHKFVSKILEQIVENRKVIHAVVDKWGTPTYTRDFATNLFRLLETERYGVYHMVCEGSGARYHVAKEILKICGRDDIELKAVNSDFFKDQYFAPRPHSEMMWNGNLRKLGLNFMRPWQDALRDYIQQEFPHAIARKASATLAEDGVERREGARSGDSRGRRIMDIPLSEQGPS